MKESLVTPRELIRRVNLLLDEVRMLRGEVRKCLLKETGNPGGISDRVIEVVAEVFGVTRAEIMGERKIEHIVWARFTAVWFTRELTGYGVVEVGRVFGIEHGTVCNCCKRFLQAELRGPVGVVKLIEQVRERLSDNPQSAFRIPHSADRLKPALRTKEGR